MSETTDASVPRQSRPLPNSGRTLCRSWASVAISLTERVAPRHCTKGGLRAGERTPKKHKSAPPFRCRWADVHAEAAVDWNVGDQRSATCSQNRKMRTVHRSVAIWLPALSPSLVSCGDGTSSSHGSDTPSTWGGTATSGSGATGKAGGAGRALEAWIGGTVGRRVTEILV